MIQGAHVGIGIRGKEGSQAVQSCDVAISKFRFLIPLLLLHGRRGYRRVALFLVYFLYKQIVLTVGDVIWAHQYEFGGDIAYPEYLLSAYSGVVTAWPIIVILSPDVDLPDDIAVRCPELYKSGPAQEYFNPKLFVMWVLFSFWHGAVAWTVPALVVDPNLRPAPQGTEDLRTTEFWLASLTSFTIAIVAVSGRLYLYSMNKLSKWTVGAIMVGVSLYILCLVLLGHTSLGDTFQPEIKALPTRVFGDWKPRLALLVGIVVALLPDLAVYGVGLCCFPKELDR